MREKVWHNVVEEQLNKNDVEIWKKNQILGIVIYIRIKKTKSTYNERIIFF